MADACPPLQLESPSPPRTRLRPGCVGNGGARSVSAVPSRPTRGRLVSPAAAPLREPPDGERLRRALPAKNGRRAPPQGRRGAERGPAAPQRRARLGLASALRRPRRLGTQPGGPGRPLPERRRPGPSTGERSGPPVRLAVVSGRLRCWRVPASRLGFVGGSFTNSSGQRGATAAAFEQKR